MTASGSASLGYDGRGNLAADGTHGYTYDHENRMVWATGPTPTSLFYDPLGRLWKTQDGVTAASRYFIYNGGLELVAEYDGSGNKLRSYVWGQGADELLVDYQDAPSWQRRFPHADERGSIIALADDSGNAISVNKYDEFGQPQAGSVAGRFGYTGQMWLPEIGVYHYKARAYSPQLGRFLQPDPIGYAAGMNLYAYVGNDPVNFVDPTGTDLQWVSRYACAGPEGSEVCGWTGYWMWKPDLFPVGTLPAFHGGLGGPRGSRHGCVIRGNCQPDQWPIPQPAPEPEKGRQCTTFQLHAEALGDSFARAGSVTTDLALVTGGAAVAAGAMGAEPLAGGLGAVSAHSAWQSGMWGALAAGSYLASGNSGKVIMDQFISFGLKKAMPFAPSKVQAKIADSISPPGNRCQ